MWYCIRCIYIFKLINYCKTFHWSTQSTICVHHALITLIMLNFRHKTCFRLIQMYFLFCFHAIWFLRWKLLFFSCEMSTLQSNHAEIIATAHTHSVPHNNENIWLPLFNNKNDFNSTATATETKHCCQQIIMMWNYYVNSLVLIKFMFNFGICFALSNQLRRKYFANWIISQFLTTEKTERASQNNIKT